MRDDMHTGLPMPIAPDGVYLEDSFLAIDTESRTRYITGRQLAGAVRAIQLVHRPRAGETVAQWLAGLVDTGQLPVKALVLNAPFFPNADLGEVHYLVLDEDRVKPHLR